MGSESAFRNKLSLALLLVVFFVLALGVTEWILAGTSEQYIVRYGEARYVQLRESVPFSKMRWWDDKKQKYVELEIDKDGYIIPSRVHESADLTIAFLGGSTTKSAEVDADKRFPYLAGRLLEKETGLRINSFNAGQDKNNTAHSLSNYLNKIRFEDPDIVVMMHNFNDIVMLIHVGGYEGIKENRTIIMNSGDTHSIFVDLYDRDRGRLFVKVLKGIKQLTIPHTWGAVRHIFKKLDKEFLDGSGIKSLSYDAEEMVRKMRTNLELFIAMVRAQDAVPILMTQFGMYFEPPYTGNATPLDNEEFSQLYKKFSDTIKQVSADFGVPMVNLEPVVPASTEYVYDGIHLTDKGSLLVAEEISMRLLPIVQEIRRARNSIVNRP